MSILGATVSPYLLNFYSSGTIEEKLTEKELWVNSTTAYLGMCFGGVVSMGVLVTSAMVLGPKHITVDSYDQAALMLVAGVRPVGSHALRLLRWASAVSVRRWSSR